MSPLRLARLWWTMLRYRVAVMLWVFLALGAAAADGLARLGTSHLCAALALAALYVAATTVNDISDLDVDRINHPDSPGRPLVNGEATPSDLMLVHAVAVALALALGAMAGPGALLPVLVSLALGYAYSVPPLRLSYRTWATPLVLASAYVVVPFWLGTVVAGGEVTGPRRLLLPGLATLFVGRIVLKDFRDRAGDAAFGKRTLLLRFGKAATCGVSVAAVLAADALLVAALRPGLLLGLVLQAFLAAVVAMLVRLGRTEGHDAEQFTIGAAAKVGNGFLLTVLGLLVLDARGAPAGHRLLFAASLAALYGAALAVLLSRPGEAVIGYRG